MTFTQIKTRIKSHCLLSSPDADTRIGISINQHYRRITALLGLDPIRFVTRNATTTNGVRTVTFSDIEKIDRVIDATDSTAIRPLTEASIHEIRSSQPGTDQPDRWALQNTAADAVTILLDTIPQTAYSLQADGTSTLGDMSGSDEPQFSESFHDILSFTVIAEELLKKEKETLADRFDVKAEKAIADLRFTLADSPTRLTRQGESPGGVGLGSAGGGGGTVGGTAYTQSALITFDRGAGIVPFAVARSDAPYVVNLGAEFLGNVTTDRLIGRDTAATGESEQLTVGGGIEFTGSGGIQTTAFTGDVTKAAGGTAQTIANDAVTFAKMQNAAANTVIARAASSSGDLSEVALSASQLAGRGSSGDVAAITLGTNLSMSGTTLNAGGGTLTLLKAGSGSSVSTTAETFDSIAITGLTALDTLKVYFTIEAVTQNDAGVHLRNTTDGVDLSENINPAAGVSILFDVSARQLQGSATSVFWLNSRNSAANVLAGASAKVAFTTNWTGSWTLGLRHDGITSGGTLKWAWAVYKVAGQ